MQECVRVIVGWSTRSPAVMTAAGSRVCSSIYSRAAMLSGPGLDSSALSVHHPNVQAPIK